MASVEDGKYRLRVAQGFLAEASQDVTLQRWRSCVDNSQLATENAAKAVAAVYGPVGRTHQAADLLRSIMAAGQVPAPDLSAVTRLADLAESLGSDIHAASDYGDENQRRTPWELFDEATATMALASAEEALTLAEPILDERGET